MPRFPVVSAKQLIEFFENEGYRVQRQTGSHIMMDKPGAPRPLSIPNNNPVSIGVVHTCLKIAQIGRDEFIDKIQNAKQHRKQKG